MPSGSGVPPACGQHVRNPTFKFKLNYKYEISSEKNMKNTLAALAKQKNKLFKISKRDLVTSIGPFSMLLVIALIAAYFYIDPAPPQHIVFSIGREDGEYQEYATKYQQILAKDDVALETRQSEGTLDNLQKLKDEYSAVNIAFILDGLHDEEEADIYSLGSISYEPIWVFYRDKKTLSRLSDFEKKKIAIGQNGSGTQILARRLLAASGINEANADLVTSGREDAIKLFDKGQVDALFLIGQPDSTSIKKLLSQQGVRVLDFDQAAAYTRQFPFLHELILPHGSIDLQRNIPAVDLNLLATTSTIAIHDRLHPAIVSLWMKAMTEVHEGPGLLHKKHTFPQNNTIDFKLSPDAQRYYKSGPPFLQRYLPFWLATLFDRVLIVLIPLFALLIPLSKTIPQIYRWRIKRRINRWYRELILLETKLRSGKDYDEYLRTLEWIDEQVAHVPIPLAFSDHSYVLKEHIDFVRRKILRFKNGSKDNNDLVATASAK